MYRPNIAIKLRPQPGSHVAILNNSATKSMILGSAFFHKAARQEIAG
jgi:hypothetical protein